MDTQTKICQNCKKDFRIEPEDFAFCERIKVPPPTFCASCRYQRRLAFRNERSLYKRKCAGTGKSIISAYSADKPYKIFEQNYWWSDEWDPMSYGRDYDFGRPFFEQFRELQLAVPRPNLNAVNPVNSEYCNYVADVKNSYLCFGSIAIEDCLYGSPYESKSCVDTYLARESEFCYECLDSEKMSHCAYVQDCANSLNLIFCYDCKNCQDCLGCAGLRNKKYHIYNQPYSKEEYEEKLAGILGRGRSGLEEAEKEFQKIKSAVPHRFATTLQCVDFSGDHLVQSKNVHECFDVKRTQDSKYSIRMIDAKDVYDTNYCEFLELCYDYIGFWKNNSVRFSNTVGESNSVEYSELCSGSSHLFGCIGLRSKSHCILNKQYSKEDYEVLVPKIIAHMSEMPYTDRAGKTYKYGEFFPAELSPFAYNETVAQELFPLGEKEAKEQGCSWKEPEERNYQITLPAGRLPAKISETPDSAVEEVIGCAHEGTCLEQCTTAFKITPAELQFYRRMKIPLPRLCPNCRHYARLAKRAPFKLWKRDCACEGSGSGSYKNTGQHFHKEEQCPNTFQTSYAPDRPEIVYCEECYNAEIV